MTVFQSYEWNMLVLKQYFNSCYNRLFSTVYCYETENAIAPIIVQKKGISFRWIGRKKGIYFLGVNSYSDYLNFIYSDIQETELIELINEIRDDFDKLPFYLTFVREDTLTQKICVEYEAELYHKMVSVEVHLPNSKSDYDKQLTKSTRQNLRTSLNRMRRDNVEYKLDIKNGIIGQTLADKLVPIHLRRVLEKNSVSNGIVNSISNWLRRRQLVYSENNNNIVNNAMRTLPNSILIICELDGQIAGYLYGLTEESTVRILQNCFVDEYKFYSPMIRGTYDFLVKQIENREISCVDFTRGDEGYKYKLGGIDVNLYSYLINRNL